MKTVSSNDIRKNFSEFLDISRREPVAITRHGRPVTILVAKEDYDRLIKIEDSWWQQQTILPAEPVGKDIEKAVQDMDQGKGVKNDVLEG